MDIAVHDACTDSIAAIYLLFYLDHVSSFCTSPPR
jgi:hypothetical protein